MKKIAVSMIFIMAIITSLFIADNSSLSQMLSSNPDPEPVAIAERSERSERSPHKQLTFDQQIDAWIQHLANKDEHMQRWKNATWNKQALGPGLHGWLILITHEGEDVGYLVVSSVKEDGSLRLIEYGTGPYPLYSQQTLYRTLVQHHLLDEEADLSMLFTDDQNSYTAFKRYFGPLQTVWEITDGEQTVLFDAITGEMYPPDLVWPESSGYVHEPVAKSTSKIEQQFHLHPFDPFEKINWVDNAFADIAVPSELIRLLHQSEPLTYTARIFNERMLIPFAVSGYHLWTDQVLYVCLEYEGKRFISFPELLQFGEFYPDRD